MAEPAPGHVYPTLPLVEELVRRGHRVSYVTGERLVPTVASVGATALPLPHRPWPDLLTEFTAEVLSGILKRSIASARLDFPMLTTHFEHDRPDAVCYDSLSFIGRLLAHKLPVLDVALFTTLASNGKFLLKDQFEPESFDSQHPKLIESVQQLHTFATEHGPADSGRAWWEIASLNLVFLPKQFQIAAETFDERFHFLGPSLGLREHVENWQPPKGAALILFISLGTVFNQRPDFFRLCVQAFAEGSWQVVMAIGEEVNRKELGQIPVNFEVRSYFPQPTVLRHAHVFLSHAGPSSIMESLYYGVPLVMVPQTPEQQVNACRTEELGLGRRLLTAQVTAEILREAVAQVNADPQIRTNAARMRTTIHNCGGAALGADVIEAHLACRS
ncbi:MAG: macrolide family glycosyltransferase [Candidatus Dormibacteria bacterium]